MASDYSSIVTAAMKGLEKFRSLQLHGPDEGFRHGKHTTRDGSKSLSLFTDLGTTRTSPTNIRTNAVKSDVDSGTMLSRRPGSLKGDNLQRRLSYHNTSLSGSPSKDSVASLQEIEAFDQSQDSESGEEIDAPSPTTESVSLEDPDDESAHLSGWRPKRGNNTMVPLRRRSRPPETFAAECRPKPGPRPSSIVLGKTIEELAESAINDVHGLPAETRLIIIAIERHDAKEWNGFQQYVWFKSGVVSFLFAL